jgi:hypothetical protein
MTQERRLRLHPQDWQRTLAKTERANECTSLYFETEDNDQLPQLMPRGGIDVPKGSIWNTFTRLRTVCIEAHALSMLPPPSQSVILQIFTEAPNLSRVILTEVRLNQGKNERLLVYNAIESRQKKISDIELRLKWTDIISPF